jgi:Sec-independent protein translocase protein TatA
MFTLGLTEIIVIIIVIIILVKPEDLPGFMRKIGRLYNEVKKAYKDVNKIKDDFVNIADPTDIEIKNIKK